MSKFYLTTPIYYANAPLHLGHAYCSTACDVLARWRRLRGDDVRFITGTDEHGGNIEKVAAELGVTPQQLVDRQAADDLAFFKELGIAHDDFVRTTEARHHRATEEFWKRVAAGKAPDGKPNLSKGAYEGLYCRPCEAYYAAEDLDDGKCPTHHLPVEVVKEETYFFHLSGWEAWLKDAYKSGKLTVVPETRFNEVMGFINEGLRDFSTSRTKVSWGFPVPGDPAHVIYVWFDALITYLTAAGFPDDMAAFGKWWPADSHVIGKEILRFHAVWWPAMLEAAGLPLPRKVVAHGWWTVNGDKMSKTTGNVIDPRDYARKHSLDAVRHFFLTEIGFGADGDFSDRRFIERYNTDLANVFGNLSHRTIAMAHRYFAGSLARPTGPSPWPAHLQEHLVQLVDDALAAPQFSVALEGLWEVIKSGNKYLDERAPWNNAETREETLGQVAVLLEAVSWPLLAFMPETGAKLRQRLGLPADKRVPLPERFTLTAGDPLFPRIDTKKKP